MIQLLDPVEWFRPLVEADGTGDFVVRPTDDVTEARPRDGPETHGARLALVTSLWVGCPLAPRSKYPMERCASMIATISA
jgi:hypothetical protein